MGFFRFVDSTFDFRLSAFGFRPSVTFGNRWSLVESRLSFVVSRLEPLHEASFASCCLWFRR